MKEVFLIPLVIAILATDTRPPYVLHVFISSSLSHDGNFP